MVYYEFVYIVSGTETIFVYVCFRVKWYIYLYIHIMWVKCFLWRHCLFTHGMISCVAYVTHAYNKLVRAKLCISKWVSRFMLMVITICKTWCVYEISRPYRVRRKMIRAYKCGLYEVPECIFKLMCKPEWVSDTVASNLLTD